MASVFNSIKRLVIFFLALLALAAITILLYNSFIAAPISGRSLLDKTIEISISLAFWISILLFIRRSRPLMAKHIGDQATTILQVVMATVAVLFMISAVLYSLGVAPESLLTGAGFASITIGLIISTFVGSLLAGALVFTTHKLRVGDSVIVNNTTGIVVEFTPLVTRVRTGKGLITIPNSAINSGAIVITKLSKPEPASQSKLPFTVGDRVVTTYMADEGTVTQITDTSTIIKLDDGKEITLLNSSILSGSVGIARIAGKISKANASNT